MGEVGGGQGGGQGGLVGEDGGVQGFGSGGRETGGQLELGEVELVAEDVVRVRFGDDLEVGVELFRTVLHYDAIWLEL